MTISSNAPICIVGAGAIGVGSALWLQRRGHAVTLIDPGEPGAGASSGNAGCFNPSSIVPVAMPGVLRNVPKWLLDPDGPLTIRWSYLHWLAPWLLRFVRAGTAQGVAAQARALRDLMASSIDDMTLLASTAGVANLLRHEGHLVTYASEAAFLADAPAWELRRANGVAFETWDRARIEAFDPAIGPERRFAVYIGENGHTSDPAALVAGLGRHVVAQGGTILRTRATGFRRESRQVVAVETEQGAVACSAVVLAAGAHSRQLAHLLGDAVPLETERGYHLMIANPPVMPRVPVTDAIGRFVATPMAGGLRLAGTVELAGLEAAPDWRRAEMLLRLARPLLPGLDVDPDALTVRKWMGFRPSMPDSLPVLSPARAADNAVHAFGHGHIGLTAAASTGRIVADMIEGKSATIDLSPFRADRFRR